MTHTALAAAQKLSEQGLNIGIIDLFLFRVLDKAALYTAIQDFSVVITLEEAFICCGGMDSLIADVLLENNNTRTRLVRLGIRDKHVFESGGRAYLHSIYGLDVSGITRMIKQLDM
jgi:transketolase